ncbi:hypothetical protein CV102_10670 [Natronococcus pandeyae]|uniref:Uncharacterized protein n=1 Tax=Natronococcus pandeyae TaxID=2055836 RepID=A0A8J8Q4G6_9EURY|nr:hypothetical protein [Natronococcus pandeyae]TYL38957.1 hypothetical protein CV102_10670 [Natronococcus pandeyae]
MEREQPAREQTDTEHSDGFRGSNDRVLGRRSYLKLTGGAMAALGVGTGASATAAGDESGPAVIDIDYDEYEDPGAVYDVNDVRGSYTPEFVTDRSTRDGRSLRTEFTSDSKIANCEYRLPEKVGEHQDEVYTRFTVHPENFDLGANDTVRMFWAPLTNGDGSSGGGSSGGTNGWSNAIGFANRNDSPAPDGYKFFSYAYHMDGSGDFQMTDAVVQMDEWNEIECHIKVNTSDGGSANADGVMRYWVNGDLAFEDTSMRFTTSDDNRIEAVGPLGYMIGNVGGALYYDEHQIVLDADREEARSALE